MDNAEIQDGRGGPEPVPLFKAAIRCLVGWQESL